MARFYSNENFPLPVVVALRGLGHDVLTSLEAGQANRKIPDEKVVEFATNAARAVLTLNRRHFAREHQRSARHGGIVTCTVDEWMPRKIPSSIAAVCRVVFAVLNWVGG